MPPKKLSTLFGFKVAVRQKKADKNITLTRGTGSVAYTNSLNRLALSDKPVGLVAKSQPSKTRTP